MIHLSFLFPYHLWGTDAFVYLVYNVYGVHTWFKLSLVKQIWALLKKHGLGILGDWKVIITLICHRPVWCLEVGMVWLLRNSQFEWKILQIVWQRREPSFFRNKACSKGIWVKVLGLLLHSIKLVWESTVVQCSMLLWSSAENQKLGIKMRLYNVQVGTVGKEEEKHVELQMLLQDLSLFQKEALVVF